MIALADGRKMYASPDDDTQTAFLDFISSATKSVLIADYSLTVEQLATILPELKAKGVDVKLVLDKTQAAGKYEKALLNQLHQAGIDIVVGTSTKHQILHDKLAVVDDTTLYGSWNFSKTASAEDNFFIIDPSPQVSAWFTTVILAIRAWILANEPTLVFNEADEAKVGA